MPDLRRVLRSCAAPLLGYALALAAALVVTGLLVAAIAIGTDSSGAGDPSDEIDIEAIGTLVGMPFQVAAMALGGSLGFQEDGLSVGLYAPPLLVTMTFVVAVFVLSRRAERRSPSGSTTERVVLAASGAFATSVLVLVLTRALAMRSDGTSLNAATVGLFFGCLVGAATAGLLGRTSATRSLWPRLLPPDARRAIHLTTQHVLVTIVVLIPLVVVWIGVEVGADAALACLAWGPTAALDAFGLAHLGALSLAGEQGFAWDLGWLSGIALPLVALALALLASIAWHLRRDTTPPTLSLPASWTWLPATYAVAALVVCLASTMAATGGYADVGGGIYVHLAYWLIPVLAVWGLVVEVLSRFVAPALVGAVPGALQRRLARGPAHPTSDPAPATVRIPMSPTDRVRARHALIGVGVLAAVAVVGGIAYGIVGATLYDPEAAAEDYLDALVAGDLEEAVRLAPIDDDGLDDTPASSALLTDEVYAAGSDRPTGYEITDVTTTGDTTVVAVTLEGLAETEEGNDVELTLRSSGTRALFFDDWQVADGGVVSQVSIPLPEESTELLVNGVAVEVDGTSDYGTDFWAYPASYSFNPYGESEWLELPETRTPVPAAQPYGTYADLASPTASPALMEVVTAEIDDLVERCMAATELEPAGCPQSAFGYGDDVRDVQWTSTSSPTLDWDGFDGTFPYETSVDGEASVTYEYDESYGYGRPEWTEESSDETYYLEVSVDLIDGEPSVTFDSY